MFFPLGDPCRYYRGPTDAITLTAKAACHGKIDYVRTVFSAASQTPNLKAFYPTLNFAIIQNQLDIVRYLLSLYPPPRWEQVDTHYFMQRQKWDTTYPRNLLRDITRDDNPELMKILMTEGLDPNWLPELSEESLQPFPESLLYYSAGHAGSLGVLLEFGANAQHPGNHKYALRTPMCAAAEADSPLCLELLLSHGDSFEHALFIAARSQSFRAVKYLLERGANIDEHHFFQLWDYPEFLDRPRGEETALCDGGTALHAAIVVEEVMGEPRGAYLEMCKFLLAHGASLEERDHTGRRPYDYALELKSLWSQGEIDLFKPKSL